MAALSSFLAAPNQPPNQPFLPDWGPFLAGTKVMLVNLTTDIEANTYHLLQRPWQKLPVPDGHSLPFE